MAVRPSLSRRGRIVIAVAGTLAWLSQTTAAQTPLTLDDAIAQALAHNPTVQAARLGRAVATANVSLAAVRPNPEVTYEASRELPHQAVGAAWPFEIGGKRGRRVALAQSGVLLTDADIDIVIADVTNDVRRAYLTLVWADARVALADDAVLFAQRARDAGQARFAAGDAPRLEAVLTELAWVDAQNDASSARGEVTAARAELNGLLGRPLNSAFAVVRDVAPPALAATAVLVERALQASVDIAAADRRVEEQAARTRLTAANRVPDVVAGAGFTYHAQPEFGYGWRVTFGVPLPVFDTGRRAVAVEDASLSRLRAEREAAASRVVTAVTVACARAQAARDQLTRFESDVLPRAADVERMAQDGYSAGQTPLGVLLQTLSSVRDIRVRHLQATLDYHLALADLERAMGTRLP